MNEPNPNNSLKDAQEYSHVGRQFIVNQKNTQGTRAVTKFCATNAQTPNPIYAITTVIINDTTDETMVIFESFLNLKFFRIWLRWIILKA